MSGCDVAILLQRAIERSADAAGTSITTERNAAVGWASATFTGARHELTLIGAKSAALDRWLAGLAEAELPLRGHLVADLKLISFAQVAAATTATIEVLTVEER